ncbi:MAG: flagellar protein [Lachnospiraceae bacterium]|nr:flagellar protein [Lachnospiraceae bacterium]
MDIRNCRGCGKMIQYMGVGPVLCASCRKKLDEDFARVKVFLKENPNCTINELSESADVSISQINQWIREERLVFSKDSPIGIDCEKCGRMIKSGRFCGECKKDLIKNLGGDKSAVRGVAKTPTSSAKGRMRFLDK